MAKTSWTEDISIHALLAESDLSSHVRLVALYISIHALLAESDLFEYMQVGTGILFLSTLSLRRATNGFAGVLFLIDISIHALLAESDSRRALGFVDPDISIHALLAESDSWLDAEY